MFITLNRNVSYSIIFLVLSKVRLGSLTLEVTLEVAREVAFF